MTRFGVVLFTVGNVTASHEMLTLQALLSLSIPELQREAACADER